MRRPSTSFAESPWLVALLLTVVPFSQVPLDAYTPAMPDMVRDLKSTNAMIQNSVTAYVLGLSVSLILAGILSDAFGRRRVLLGGLGVLFLASVGCALADHALTLLLLRFVQGIGGSVCSVVVYAVAADCFQGRKLTAISGWLGAAWGIAPVVAPAAGGMIVQFASWRVIFIVIAGCVALMMAAVFVLLQETLPPERRIPLNVLKSARVARNALRNGAFTGLVLVFTVIASAQLAFGVVAPFLYQDRLGFSPAAYRGTALLVGLANLTGEMACGHLADRIAPRKLCFGAWGFFFAGGLILAVSGMLDVVGFGVMTSGFILALAGCGTLCPAAYGMALGLFERNLGLIGGIITTVCYSGVAITLAGLAVLPEHNQGPLGLLYVVMGVAAFALLLWSLSKCDLQSSVGQGNSTAS